MLNIDPALLAHWNTTLATLSPQEIIQWAIHTFPGLYQTTAFGLSGLCILDMASHTANPPQLVFVDTLYHFPQTLELVDQVVAKYHCRLHVYKPKHCLSDSDFVALHGDNLWQTDEPAYDYHAKVEPLARAYKDLAIQAVFTGRRSSQGAHRSRLAIVELDPTLQVVKINPLANWSFGQVQQYLAAHHVPTNSLLALGYRSVGDWHSTVPVAADDPDERAGRWAGRAKTECGIHTAGQFANLIGDEGKREHTENENENENENPK